MQEYGIDIPVLLIFFARPEPFAKVFKQVKAARPSKIYLYQDGPRHDHPKDIEGILACRKIALDIDWNCEIHTFFQSENVGCDPSEYIAQKWMFKTEEMGIVLEDDDVPSLSFFPFCKELLEKYKDDERINMICGMNNTEVCEYTPYDYIFTTSGSICGWASWKRVIDTWDANYSILNDTFNLKQLIKYVNTFQDSANFIDTLKLHKQVGKAYYESILGASMFLNHRLNIVPSKNLISNIGITENATHSVSKLSMLPKSIRKIFFMKTYEYTFPLKHPPYVIDDVEFRKRIHRIMGKGHPMIKLYRKMESIVLRLKHKDFKGLIKSFRLKLKSRK